ncbi:MAG: hypothetical protein CMH26_07145 [Micavibrio sp.]|nr:hypothetical protein [Micavibrio sp.]
MSAFKNLFNAVQNPDSTEADIASANLAFSAEKLDKSRAIYQECVNKSDKLNLLSEIISPKNITQKISGTGHNIVINRQEGESLKQWEKRTKRLAGRLEHIAGQPLTQQSKFSNGRIYTNTLPHSNAHTLFNALINPQEQQAINDNTNRARHSYSKSLQAHRASENTAANLTFSETETTSTHPSVNDTPHPPPFI